jgi:hypothetical protein
VKTEKHLLAENRILQSLITVSTTSEFLKECLNIIGDTRSSSSTLLLLDGPSYRGLTEKAFIGRKRDDYTYLDNEICNQLEESSRIFIPDSTKFRKIKFLPGEAFPKAIVGFSEFIGEKRKVIFWETYDQTENISKSDVDFFESMLQLIALGLEKLFEKIDQIAIVRELSSAIDSFDSPCFVINRDDELIYSNSAAKEFISNYPEMNDPSNKSIILGIFDENSAIHKDLKKTFSVHIQEIQDRNSSKIIILEDDSQSKKLNKIVELIIKIANRTLKSNLVEAAGYGKMIPLIGKLNRKQELYVNNILARLERSLEEIDSLFDIDRLIEGRGIIISAFDLSSILFEVIQLISPEAVKNRVELVVKIDTLANAVINADQSLCRHIFFDLIRFALSQSGMGRQLHITAEETENEYQISISDSGNGFSSIAVDAIRDGEKTVESKLRNLNLIKDICLFQGMKFEFTSKLNVGSKYSIFIPKET